ncbi:hypothetical protein RAC89_03460 [Paenibacillus sp. GD4]|uniref:hypothetical protein n=1 Tax=Paenibacillus sp. GD4 TaxID=3068890 RepID=UPI002796693F|nr:hypothetical protein [Paenibacillus sp. GD4]MDQ1909561.1 hypothetical protein [Paenibacillus sp. GD4]
MRTTTNMEAGLQTIQPRVHQGFADSITTKYGFAAGNYLGRQSLVYWEPNEGTVIQPPPVQKVSLQQYVVNLKLQLMAMQKEEQLVLSNQRAMLQMLEKVTERQAVESKRAERREEASGQGAQGRSKQAGSNAGRGSRSTKVKEPLKQEQAVPKRTRAAKRPSEEKPQDERSVLETNECTAKRGTKKRSGTAPQQKADDSLAAEMIPKKRSRSKKEESKESKQLDELPKETGKKPGRTRKANGKTGDQVHQEIHAIGGGGTGDNHARASAWISKKPEAARTRGSLNPRLTQGNAAQLAGKAEAGYRAQGRMVKRPVQIAKLTGSQLTQDADDSSRAILGQNRQGQVQVRKAGQGSAAMSLINPVVLQRFAAQGIRHIWMQRNGSGAEQVHRIVRRRIEEGVSGGRWFRNHEAAAVKPGRSTQVSSLPAKRKESKGNTSAKAVSRRPESESGLGYTQPVQTYDINKSNSSLRERFMWKPTFYKQLGRKAHPIENNQNHIDAVPVGIQGIRGQEGGRQASAQSVFGQSSSPVTDVRLSSATRLYHRETAGSSNANFARSEGKVQYRQASAVAGAPSDARSSQAATLSGAQAPLNGNQESPRRSWPKSISSSESSRQQDTAYIDKGSEVIPTGVSRTGARGTVSHYLLATDRLSFLGSSRSHTPPGTGTVLQYRLAPGRMSSFESGSPIGNRHASASIFRNRKLSEAGAAAGRNIALRADAGPGRSPSTYFAYPVSGGAFNIKQLQHTGATHPLQRIRTMFPDNVSLLHRHAPGMDSREAGLAKEKLAQVKNGRLPNRDRNDAVRTTTKPVRQLRTDQSSSHGERGIFTSILRMSPLHASTMLTSPAKPLSSQREGLAAAAGRDSSSPVSQRIVLSHPALSATGTLQNSPPIRNIASVIGLTGNASGRVAPTSTVSAARPNTYGSAHAANGYVTMLGRAGQASVGRAAPVMRLLEGRNLSDRNQRQSHGNRSSNVTASVSKRCSSQPASAEHRTGRSDLLSGKRGKEGGAARNQAVAGASMLSANTSWAPAMSQAVAAALSSNERTVRKPASTATAAAPQAKFAEPSPKLEFARTERDAIYGELTTNSNRARDLFALPVSAQDKGRGAAHRHGQRTQLQQGRYSGAGPFGGSFIGTKSRQASGTAHTPMPTLHIAWNHTSAHGQGERIGTLNSGAGRWIQRQPVPTIGAFHRTADERLGMTHSASQGVNSFATRLGVPPAAAVQSVPGTAAGSRATSTSPVAYAPLALQNRAPKAETVGVQPAANSARGGSSAVTQLEHHKSKRSNPDELAAQAATKAIRQVEEKLKTVEVEITKTVQAAQASLPNMGRFVDKVYKELEKKIKFERQRRGL